jgi:hypothetical protein
MAVDHLLIDFEAPVGWVEVEEAPANLTLGKTLVDREVFSVCDSNAASFILMKLIYISIPKYS